MTPEVGIFNSAHQALHFSFLMEILPVTQKSVMQSIIDRLMEDMGIVVEREKGTINFGGLTALEIRGQCAMVRGLVTHHLPKPEIDAVHARFGQQVCKATGVRGIRDYAAPMLSITHDDTALAIAWSIYGTARQREGLSVNAISAESKYARATVNKDLIAMKNVAKSLETRAIDRLTVLMEKGGLIYFEENLQTA